MGLEEFGGVGCTEGDACAAVEQVELHFEISATDVRYVTHDSRQCSRQPVRLSSAVGRVLGGQWRVIQGRLAVADAQWFLCDRAS